MLSKMRIPVAVATVVIWTLITVWGIWTPPGPYSLGVFGSISWNNVAAGAFALAVVLVMRWRDVGFNAPLPWRSVTLFWFPLINLALFFFYALAVGLPPTGWMFFAALNTLAAAFSEELAFRGVLFRALGTRLSLWNAAWLTSALFSSVYVIGALISGDLMGALFVSFGPFMSGLFFLVMVLRTGSIWPSMIFHAAWDLLILAMFGGGAMAGAGAEIVHSPGTFLWPLVFIIPNFAYGLFLLRKVGPLNAAPMRPDQPNSVS